MLICIRIVSSTFQKALAEKKLEPLSAKITWVPQNRVEIGDLKIAERVIKLINLLEDDDDVQHVHANFDITEEVASQLSSS